jgi:hypothetical protein
MSLLELLTVVAIIGALSAVSGGFTVQMLRTQQVNSAGKTLAASLSAARQRAITSRCAHLVQVNGPTYAGGGVNGFPVRPGTVSLIRKANCDSTVASFQDGDRVIITELWLPEGGVIGALAQVRMRVPMGLVASTHLEGNGFSVAYDLLGRRRIASDNAGTGLVGFAPNTTFDGADLQLVVENRVASGDPTMQVNLRVPIANTPRLN